VTNNATLGGTNRMKLNGATNDVLACGGAIVYGGVLNAQNIGGSLAVGNSFKLFSATNYSGVFSAIVPATPGSSLAWNTNGLTNGVLSIVSGIVPQPRITAISFSGSNLVISGTNGTAGQQYTLLSSTNLTLPFTNWTAVVTNTFPANSFSTTNTISPGSARSFYLLRVP
jgi:hypothetical protein